MEKLGGSEMGGQLGSKLILGFRGLTLPDWIRTFESKHGLGGVCLFDRDLESKSFGRNVTSPDQLRQMCREIHDLPSRPLITIDQEGGKVRRLKESAGFKLLPSQKQMSAMLHTGDKNKLRSLITESFAEMVEIGIDVNLAPVIDLDYNPENPDIGAVERSFGTRIDDVLELSRLEAEIATNVGLKLCLKHFPGLGVATVNSHEDLTDLSGTIQEEQLNLFSILVKEIPGHMILLSHGLVREWDTLPMSISGECVRRVRKLCTDTPNVKILTDDLQMQGLQKLMSTREATELAIRNGVDYVIVGNNLKYEPDFMEI